MSNGRIGGELFTIRPEISIENINRVIHINFNAYRMRFIKDGLLNVFH